MAPERRSVLLCGSSPYLLETFSQIVLDGGWVPRIAKTRDQLPERLESAPVGHTIVVLDLSVKEFPPEVALAAVARRAPPPPLVAVTLPGMPPEQLTELKAAGFAWLFDATTPDHEIHFAFKTLLANPSPEKRREARAPAAAAVVFSMDGDRPREGTVRDLTEHGLFIETEQPYMLGDLIQLRFGLPDGSATVETRAEVVFRAPKLERASALLPGNGVKFRDLSDAASDALREYARRTLKRMPGSDDDRGLIGVRK